MDPTILVVEESLDLCRLFEYILRADGYKVTGCHTWQSAEAALGTSVPNLIIFDWAEVNAAGYVWACSLRDDPGTSGIPILFVCGDPPSHDMLEVLGEHGISVIEKPFDIFVFRNRVSALLGIRERSVGVS